LNVCDNNGTHMFRCIRNEGHVITYAVYNLTLIFSKKGCNYFYVMNKLCKHVLLTFFSFNTSLLNIFWLSDRRIVNALASHRCDPG